MSLIFFLAIAGLILVVLGKCISVWTENMSVLRVIKGIEASRETNVVDARKVFDKAAEIDNIRSIKSSELVFAQNGNGLVVQFDYEARVFLIGNASLLFGFEKN